MSLPIGSDTPTYRCAQQPRQGLSAQRAARGFAVRSTGIMLAQHVLRRLLTLVPQGFRGFTPTDLQPNRNQTYAKRGELSMSSPRFFFIPRRLDPQELPALRRSARSCPKPLQACP